MRRLLASALCLSAVSLPLSRAWAQDVILTDDWTAISLQDANTLDLRGYFLHSGSGAVRAVAHATQADFYELHGFANDSIPDELLYLDARHGTRTLVGNLGQDFNQLGMAIDPTTGVGYVLASPHLFPPQLYTIDLLTGALTLVGGFNDLGYSLRTFAIDAQGRAFVARVWQPQPQPLLSSYLALDRFDLSTGQIIASTSFTHPLANIQLGNAAFRSDGTLLLDDGGTLYSVDLATTSMTQVPGWSQVSFTVAPSADLGLGFVEGCTGSTVGCACFPGTMPGNGCANSGFPWGSNLRAYGVASLSNDSVSMTAMAIPNSTGILFQGSVLNSGAVFGDGRRCVGGTLRRIGGGAVQSASLTYPASGQAPVSVRGQIGAPGTYHYQLLFRDNAAYCTSATFNITNSVSVAWVP